MSFTLGRHVQHDPRSRAYAIDDIDDVMRASVQTRVWNVHCPVLDQGNLGACVGFATTAAIATDPNWAGAHATNWPHDDWNLIARSMYSEATARDEFQGQYPPTDTGSSGLGGAKAAKHFGLIAGYNHAFSPEALQKALQVGPVIVGTNWYQGMYWAAEDGEVTISGDVDGGHEWMIYGIDVEQQRYVAQNSWGESFGIGGRFAVSFSTMERLLDERGDVTQFVPLPVAPQPEPEPVKPEPTADDLKLWLAMQAWASRKGLR